MLGWGPEPRGRNELKAAAWQVTRSVFADRARKRDRIVLVESDELADLRHAAPDGWWGADPGLNPEEEAIYGQNRERLDELLALLPPGERDPVRLRVVDELTGPEIAEVLGRSHVAVRKAISRGLERLRELWGAEVEPSENAVDEEP